MKCRSLFSAALVAVALTGCALGKRMPPATTYSLDLSPYAMTPTQPRRSDTLRLATVRVVPPFGDASLMYRFDDVRYVSDPYHAFVAQPGELFANEIAQWLDAAGPFRDVATSGSLRPAAYVLEAGIAELYGDFRKDRAPSAVLRIDFALIAQRSPRPRTIFERSIAQTVTLTGTSREALIRGYSRALADALAQLTRELDAAVADIEPATNTGMR